MSVRNSRKAWVPGAFGAGVVVQLLASTAAFLAAFVLPMAYPETGETSRTVGIVLGVLFLAIAITSIVLRPWIAGVQQRLGMRSRMLLPREGIAYLGIMLIIAVGALTGGNPDTGNMLLLVFGMMAGPFVLNGWVVVAMLTRVKVKRTHPDTAEAGVYFSVDVRLRNDKRFLSSRLVEVRDFVEGQRVLEEPTVTFVRVGPGDERSGSYELCITRRGKYRFGPLRISSRFPLGIGERGHVLPGTSELVVHPAIGRLLPGWKRRERELAESVRMANARIGIFDDDFHSIREYRDSDNPRAIHWRSTARQGRLMVKEHQQHREAELVVLLDFFQTRECPEPLQEKAVSLAATLCVEQTRHTSSGMYRLAVAGKELEILEVSGTGRFRELALRTLAVCRPSIKAPLAEMLLEVVSGPITSGSRFVLITPRPEAATLLLESIARDSLRGDLNLISRVMIVPCNDAEIDALFVPNSNTTDLNSPFKDNLLPASDPAEWHRESATVRSFQAGTGRAIS